MLQIYLRIDHVAEELGRALDPPFGDALAIESMAAVRVPLELKPEVFALETMEHLVGDHLLELVDRLLE